MIIDDYQSSVHVRGEDVEALRELFERTASGIEQAYLAPAMNGWMALYPRQCDTAPRWAEIAARELKTVAVAFQVIEDEVFTYHLYTGGKLTDHYVSKPSYFLGHDEDVSREKIEAMRGKPEVWMELMANGHTPVDLGGLLHSGFEGTRSGGDYVIPSTLLEEVARFIGIEGAATTFEDLEEEIAEWRDDAECRDEDDEDEAPLEPLVVSCRREADSVVFVRAPRKRATAR